MSPYSSSDCSDWPRAGAECELVDQSGIDRQTFRANSRARVSSITPSFLCGCCLSRKSSKDNYPVGAGPCEFTHAPLDAGTRQFVVKGRCALEGRGCKSLAPKE